MSAYYALAKSVCSLCSARIAKRVTYLYKPETNSWICKDCWSVEVNSKEINSVVAWNNKEEQEHHNAT